MIDFIYYLGLFNTAMLPFHIREHKWVIFLWLGNIFFVLIYR